MSTEITIRRHLCLRQHGRLLIADFCWVPARRRSDAMEIGRARPHLGEWEIPLVPSSRLFRPGNLKDQSSECARLGNAGLSNPRPPNLASQAWA